MFGGITNFFKKIIKTDQSLEENSKDTAKERLHLVLMQDRANVSADFLELMKQEIIEVIKKYIEVDEKAIDVRLTNQPNDDGTNGAPALYANIPILNIKNENKSSNIETSKNKEEINKEDESEEQEEKIEEKENTKEEIEEESEEEEKEFEGTETEEVEEQEENVRRNEEPAEVVVRFADDDDDDDDTISESEDSSEDEDEEEEEDK